MYDEYANLDEVKQAWASGQFKFQEKILIAGLPYAYYRSGPKEFYDAIAGGKNPYVVYHTPAQYKEEAKAAGMNQWVVFLWGSPDGAKLVPYDIRTVTSARGQPMYEQQETIGDVALLKLTLPSGVVALKGKVDTGAEVSSLHCDGKPQVVGQMVKFMSRNASANAITAPLVQQQAVSSADGGTEYRPVIELDVEVNGKRVSNAMFNLNDRSKMEYPVLIGQNILEKTGFLVDPRQNGVSESEEWLTEEQLAEADIEEFVFEDVEQLIDVDAVDYELLTKVYEMLDDADLSMKDLFKHVRTKAIERIEDLEH